jgi:hypothetical protein
LPAFRLFLTCPPSMRPATSSTTRSSSFTISGIRPVKS